MLIVVTHSVPTGCIVPVLLYLIDCEINYNYAQSDVDFVDECVHSSTCKVPTTAPEGFLRIVTSLCVTQIDICTSVRLVHWNNRQCAAINTAAWPCASSIPLYSLVTVFCYLCAECSIANLVVFPPKLVLLDAGLIRNYCVYWPVENLAVLEQVLFYSAQPCLSIGHFRQGSV
jgi:hypothetical protein